MELVRRVYDAWNERGPESIEQFWAEDAEFHDPPNFPDSRVVRGRDAIAAYQTDQVRVLGDMKFDARRCERAGSDSGEPDRVDHSWPRKRD